MEIEKIQDLSLNATEKHLIEELRKGNLNAEKNIKYKVLKIAIGRNYNNFFKELLAKSPEIDLAIDIKEGYNLLNICVNHKNMDLTEFLINKGVDINTKSKENATHLITACNSCAFEMVSLLIKMGADVNMVGANGNTALKASVVRYSKKITSYLLENGADVDQINLAGQTALFSAAANGDLEVLTTLLKYKPDPTKRAFLHNNTALEVSILRKHHEVTKMLIKYQDRREYLNSLESEFKHERQDFLNNKKTIRKKKTFAIKFP